MDYSPQALRPLQDLEEVKKLLLARCEKVIEGLKLCLLKLVHILVLYTICSSIEFGDLRNCGFLSAVVLFIVITMYRSIFFTNM